MAFGGKRTIGLVAALLGIAATLTSCDAGPKAPGTVIVAYSTNQGDENLFVWGVSVDGASPHTVNSADKGFFVLDAVAAGDHHLILSSLPSRCTSGDDNRLVTVASKDTLNVAIAVKCTRTTGDVAVIVATSGADFDPDGYLISIDGSPGPTIAANFAASVFLPKLAPGSHEITLSGFARNCALAPAAPHTAVVTVGQATPLTINVICTSLSGTIRVVTSSTVSPVSDPDGYVLTVTGGRIVFIPNNASTDLSVPAGTYDLTISDVEPSCSASPTKQTVSVGETQTVAATFTITCTGYPPSVAGIAVDDPPNDTLANNAAAAPPAAFDILKVSTRYSPTYMAISLKLGRPIAGTGMRGFIDLDLDENPATGVRPVMNDPVVGGSAPQGSEKFIYFEPDAGAGLFLSATGEGSLINMSVDADSVVFFLPLSKLADDGNLTITTVLGTARPMDYAPNTGVIVSHVPPAASLGASLVLAADPLRSTSRVVQQARCDVHGWQAATSLGGSCLVAKTTKPRR